MEFFEKALCKWGKSAFKLHKKHILEEAGIAKAKSVIIALHDIESIELLSHTIKDLNSKVKILAKVTKKVSFLIRLIVKILLIFMIVLLNYW